MSFLSLLITFLKYFPEMVDLLKTLSTRLQDGWTEIQVRQAITGITRAFNNTNRQVSARELNDIFRGKP